MYETAKDRGAQELWHRLPGVLKMTKVSGKPKGSSTVMEQLTPYFQDKKMKTSYQPRSKRSVKVAREP